MVDCFFFTHLNTLNGIGVHVQQLLSLYSFRPAAGCQTSDTDVKHTLYTRGIKEECDCSVVERLTRDLGVRELTNYLSVFREPIQFRPKALLNESNYCTCTQIPYSENKGIIGMYSKDIFAQEHGLNMVLILVFVFIKY